MNKIYTILCSCLLFACSKKAAILPSEQPQTPAPPVVEEQPKPPTNPSSPDAITPPTFRYDASLNVIVGGEKDTLRYDPSVKDYGPIIKDMVYALYWKGTGTLYIAPGKYPVQKSTALTFYPTNGVKKLSIVGIPDAAGNLPVLYDTEINRKPHNFLEFCSSPGNIVEFYISAVEIIGNNIPLDNSHPFYGKPGTGGRGIFLANMHKSQVTNVKIKNMYGDAISSYNWASNFMTDYNIGESATVNNCYLIDNWSDNQLHDSGDGIMFYHVNKPRVTNTVISNNYTAQKKYGRGGIIIEAGTKDAIVENSFIQGYRNGVICERGFGGHLFQSNTIYNNQQSGISFAHAMSEVQVLGPDAYTPNQIRNNTFEFHQNYQEFGANLWSFVVFYTNVGFALAGTEVTGNTFIANEQNSPIDKRTWTTVGNPYNFYVKTNGQEGIIIGENSYQ